MKPDKFTNSNIANFLSARCGYKIPSHLLERDKSTVPNIVYIVVYGERINIGSNWAEVQSAIHCNLCGKIEEFVLRL